MSQDYRLSEERIIVDPTIMAGKPVIKGTRIPVELILKRLSQDLDIQELLKVYPRLTEEDIRACMELAYRMVAGDQMIMMKTT
jgi:uncharacterized protein (DUF433 family)